jgi:hypothetical protein
VTVPSGAGFELNGEAVSDSNGGPVARGDADRAPPPAVVADAQYSCSFGRTVERAHCTAQYDMCVRWAPRAG